RTEERYSLKGEINVLTGLLTGHLNQDYLNQHLHKIG
ncbi:hypothetical protein EAI_17358, partial [Harpegnathos saltator]